MNIKRATYLRLRACLVHATASVALYAMLVWACHSIWFPGLFFAAMSGSSLLGLVVGCGLVLGPCLTAVVFNPAKGDRELRQDILIVVLLQTLTFVGGVYLLDSNRPKYIVYNAGQFNAVSSSMLDSGAVPPDVHPSWWGPTIIGATQPQSIEERNRIMLNALEGGHDIYTTPSRLVPYAVVRDDARNKALSPNDYVRVHGGDIEALEELTDAHLAGFTPRLLPLMIGSRHAVAVVDTKTGDLLATGLSEP